jgi:putative DNA methylase
MAATHPRKKLIEVSIPLEAIDSEAQRRKQKAPKGYPTSIHKYWAQRPIAACRAVLFAQMVDDPSSWPEKFPTDEEQGAERKRLHKVIERLVPWEASTDEAILNEGRWEIARSVAWGLGEEPPAKGDGKAILNYLQTKAPPVYDPFSGGGSIPLEAQRLGLRAFGSDLNPVAVLIGKALVEIPPKFVGKPPLNPKAQAEITRGGHWNGRGAQGLAEDVRYYGQWLRDEAEKRIGHLYPKARLPDGTDATVIAWIWARTVRSPDPSAKGAAVPLLSSFVLSTKEGKKVWLEPLIPHDRPEEYEFKIRTGSIAKDEEALLKRGTKTGRGSNFSCLLTGAPIDEGYVKAEGFAGRLGLKLVATVVESQGKRFYVAATPEHEKAAASVEPDWVPTLEMPKNPRWFSPPEFGFLTYGSLFTKRQLEILNVTSDLIEDVRRRVIEDSVSLGISDDQVAIAEGGVGVRAYAEAICTYLAFAIDRMATYGSTLCKWLTKDNALAPSIPQQAIAMSYDFAEANPFGKSSGEILQCVSVVSSCIEKSLYDAPAHISECSAQHANIGENCLLATDPPYYDNIGYADISEFFYVWMGKSLKNIWPSHLRRLSTPKDQELVATPYRHGGSEGAESYFISGMKNAIRNLSAGLIDAAPATIYYAFRQTEDDTDGVSSKGWASFLQAVVDSGLAIDGTWPLRTELTSALKTDINTLASSIVLVCRKRNGSASTATRPDFIRALKRELPDAINEIRKAGVGPVDMQQSVIGPGMGVFTRYARVLEDDDSAMSVKTALALINRVWEEIENELDAAFDPKTQVALAWFATYGFDAKSSGELIMLANAKNVALDSLFASGVFQDLRGKAGLRSRADLPADWHPASDNALTIWECVQHTARVLNAEDGGGEAAARLVAQMGPKASEARALAYRLFEIATKKGWASEALIYNELAQEWPRLEDLATGLGRTGSDTPAQARLL